MTKLKTGMIVRKQKECDDEISGHIQVWNKWSGPVRT
jgi:hypothetical protein